MNRLGPPKYIFSKAVFYGSDEKICEGAVLFYDGVFICLDCKLDGIEGSKRAVGIWRFSPTSGQYSEREFTWSGNKGPLWEKK